MILFFESLPLRRGMANSCEETKQQCTHPNSRANNDGKTVCWSADQTVQSNDVRFNGIHCCFRIHMVSFSVFCFRIPHNVHKMDALLTTVRSEKGREFRYLTLASMWQTSMKKRDINKNLKAVFSFKKFKRTFQRKRISPRLTCLCVYTKMKWSKSNIQSIIAERVSQEKDNRHKNKRIALLKDTWSTHKVTLR